MESVLVSVVVPVRDDPDGVRELLDLLEAQTLPQERFEIVIGDDGSEPGSLSGIATADGRVRVLSGPPRTSYAGRNRAAGAARGSILAFCDADCRPDAEWLGKGVEALAGADVVAGEVIFDSPSKPTGWSLLTMDMFLDQKRNVRFSRAVTANIFVRRKTFEDLNGFDESLPSGGDYEFTRRAVSHGAKLVYAPTAIIRHPTIDGGYRFLRKVWFTNRWSAVRNARLGLVPDLRALVEFIPLIGVAIARWNAHRPIATLSRPRLIASGLDPGWRDDLRAIPLLYTAVATVAGAARISGRLDGKRALRARDAAKGKGLSSPTAEPPPTRWSRTGALPNIVVIGAMKCGTASLHHYLGLHPEIAMSSPKELNFFIEKRNWHRGDEWYRRRFDPRAPVRGESSPNYTSAPRVGGVPARMASMIPDARLIYLVRDPIERIASHWVHNYSKGRERGDLRATLLHPKASYVARSCYYLQLQLFLEHFDEDQILVIESSALHSRRLYTLRRVFDFVGADPDFYHLGFDRIRHRSSEKRRATRLGKGIRQLERRLTGNRIRIPLWRSVEAGLGLSSPIKTPTNVRQALGEDVISLLREDAEKLRTLTGLPLDDWSIFSDSPHTVD